MSKIEKNPTVGKRDEALVERLFRRVLGRVGAVVDRKLGRDLVTQSGFTTSKLIERMRQLIDERARRDPKRGRIAPHLLKLKIEWGTHSEADPEALQELEHEILAAAIDHINDARLRTLAPVKVETLADIFTTGIAIDPTFGEFEDELKQQDEQRQRASEGVTAAPPKSELASVVFAARVTLPEGVQDVRLSFKVGGKRLNVGRATDIDLCLPHASVSKVHATLMVNRDGALLVSDTGSTNGTFINGRRITYGEARQIADGDVIGFGDVEVRFRKQ
ncbi:MAG: FHA domain-containing protein [Pyrinomonadaceae bacterium]|nr:FHA domain-containing protein [Pyrinomonadaceae bacterium]